jgi:hypothetical protein
MPMTQEELVPFIAATGLQDLTPDNAGTRLLELLNDTRDQALTAEQEKAVALSQMTDAQAQLQSVRQQLAQGPKPDPQPDPIALSMITEAFETKEQAAIVSGAMSQAEVDATRSLFFDKGTPGSIALSRTAGTHKPLYSRLLEIRTQFAGTAVKSGIPLSRKEAITDPTSVSGGGGTPEVPKERENELRALAGLPPK